MKIHDLIIIGTGPAGLTAALYAARYKLDVLVIGEIAGGTASKAHEVWNFPSYEKITGPALMMKMIEQVKKLGVEIKYEEVLDIKKEKGFVLTTNKEKYFAKKIIIATGSEKKKLRIDREDELTGKGVCYCATCDAGLYKDKEVGVVGGGNSALTASLLLSKFAKKVYIIYRGDKFEKAEPSWVNNIDKDKKIISLFNSEIIELIGENKLEGIKIQKDEEKKKINLDGLFVEIGGISNTKLAKLLGIELEKDFIKVDKKQKTNVEGVFAAGDVTNNSLKQIITACGEGAIATNTAYDELKK